MLSVILQQGINGIVVGSLYVLVALGLTLIYGVLVQINFAHADIVTLGAFAAYFFTHFFGGYYLVSIAVALIAGGVLGWLVNATIFAPLRERGSELLPLIATIGVRDLLIVQDGDCTLIAHRDDEGTVKQMVDELRKRGLERYL